MSSEDFRQRSGYSAVSGSPVVTLFKVPTDGKSVRLGFCEALHAFARFPSTLRAAEQPDFSGAVWRTGGPVARGPTIAMNEITVATQS
jgi:hypothetical protein